MSKTMPQSTAEEKYRWIRPIIENRATIKDMASKCPFSERSIKYWLANYKEHGMLGLENKSTRPKTSPKETPIRLKEEIIELRNKEKCCAKKLAWKLKKQGITINPRTIGKIIKKEGLTRKYRTRKVQYKYIKTKLAIGELVEIDVKYVPSRVKGRKYYQFTAIDCASRWRYLKVYEDITNHSAIEFLKELVSIAPFEIKAIKTDNGFCFTNRYTGYLKSTDPLKPRLHGFDLMCNNLNIEHYLIDPGKPQQNGTVERSHRTDQESFYDQVKFNSLKMLEYKLRLWNMYYNDLEHCGLNGLTPNEALRNRVQNVRA